MKKKNPYLLPIALIILIVVILWFAIWRDTPSMHNVIVEGDAELEKLCESKWGCKVSTGGSVGCDHPSITGWKGFKGCNESTKGYTEYNDDLGRTHKIFKDLKHCNCPPLFQ